MSTISQLKNYNNKPTKTGMSKKASCLIFQYYTKKQRSGNSEKLEKLPWTKSLSKNLEKLVSHKINNIKLYAILSQKIRGLGTT